MRAHCADCLTTSTKQPEPGPRGNGPAHQRLPIDEESPPCDRQTMLQSYTRVGHRRNLQSQQEQPFRPRSARENNSMDSNLLLIILTLIGGPLCLTRLHLKRVEGQRIYIYIYIYIYRERERDRYRCMRLAPSPPRRRRRERGGAAEACR